MKELLSKIWYLFDKKDKRKICFLSILILTGTFIEILGFSVIIPFLMVISKPEIIQENIYFKTAYELISPNSYNQFLVFVTFIIIIVFVLKNSFLFFIEYYKFKFTTTEHYKLTSRLFRSYLKNPYAFHLQRNTAQLLRNIGLVIGVISGIVLPLIRLVTDSFLIIIIFILLMVIDFTSALIVFGVLGLISILYFLLIKKKLKKYGERQKNIQGILIKQFNQGLGSIKESKILGREHFFDKTYSKYLFEFSKISKYQQSINAFPRFIIETTMVSLVLFIVLFALVRGYAIESILIALSFFGLASVRLMPSIGRINSSLMMIRFYIPSLEEVYADLKMSASNKKRITNKDISDQIGFKEEILLDNIDFSYESSKIPALKKLSIRIPKNSTIGLVGETGAGKTTVVDVILGLLIPQNGHVYVDGVNIHEKLTSWQRKAGYIPQQIYLMDDTIANNIAFGIPKEEVDLQKVNNALRLAQLQEFIDELPHGLETIIGELGIRISGGQRQRIGIARALYNDPELLIMDEATAALDNETERAFMESIESLSGKRTIIIIAHRLTTIEKANIIFFLSKGQLLASGSYAELLEKIPEFRKMAGVGEIETC
ncbi:MAG: ABC transporter ATP-binding protein/permease [Armatimonadetes bacterium]|nr:ABC transporter ATP-binding protein/permease [Armatimonadota bacterium]